MTGFLVCNSCGRKITPGEICEVCYPEAADAARRFYGAAALADVAATSLRPPRGDSMAATRDLNSAATRADVADVHRASLLTMIGELTDRRAESWQLGGLDDSRHVGEAQRHFDAELDKAVTAIGNAVGALNVITYLHRQRAADETPVFPDRGDDADVHDAATRQAMSVNEYIERLDEQDERAAAEAVGYGMEFPSVEADPGIGTTAFEDDDGPKTVLVENLPRVEVIQPTPPPTKTKERALADLKAAAVEVPPGLVGEVGGNGGIAAPAGDPNCPDCAALASGVCNKHLPF